MAKTSKYVKLTRTHLHAGKVHPRESVLEVSPKVAKYLEDEGIAAVIAAKEAKAGKIANKGADTGVDDDGDGGKGGEGGGEGGGDGEPNA